MGSIDTRPLKAYVRFDGSGRIVPGSLILRRKMPKVGKWMEIPAYECCNELTTTTSTTAYPAFVCLTVTGTDTNDGTYTIPQVDVINGKPTYELPANNIQIYYDIELSVWFVLILGTPTDSWTSESTTVTSPTLVTTWTAFVGSITVISGPCTP